MPDSGRPALGFASDASAVAHTFVDELAEAVDIEGDDGHHLARVRRLELGEGVTLADGSGDWRPYEVSDVGRGTISLRATGPHRHEPALTPRLRVAFALTKGEKPETVARQLTELGVDVIEPILAARSVVRVRGERASAIVDRLARVAREAACQSRRARVPEIEAPVPLESVVGRSGLVVADRTASPADPDVGIGSAAELTLLVGPEGGLAPDELEAVAAAPRVGVGPHVLRAETAAVAAAAVLTARRRPATP